MMQRITKISKTNLMQADRIDCISLGETWGLKAWRGNQCAVLWGARDMLQWDTPSEARRFVKRFRSDLEPTSFERQ